MDVNTETRILEAEERLRLAMIADDLEALDELLSPDLLFTTHTGILIGKQEDLAAHRSGAFKIHSLIPSDRHMLSSGETVLVSVRMALTGTYAGSPANGDFRFTRVWARAPDKASGTSPGQGWWVVGGHSSLIT